MEFPTNFSGAASSSASASTSNPKMSLQEQQQHQLYLLYHYQQQLQQQHLQQQQQQEQQMEALRRRGENSVGMEMAMKDAAMVCNPDTRSPFSSIEDAVNRLLPYHVVSDFEEEEDNSAEWDHNILEKVADFTTTLEKQVRAFNIMSHRRTLGAFRSEERLMIEQALLEEEKQAFSQVRTEMESREKARQEEAEARMVMAMAQAQAEARAQVQAQAQAHAEMMARVPMRSNAIASHGHHSSGGQGVGAEQWRNMEEIIRGWRNSNSSSSNIINNQDND